MFNTLLSAMTQNESDSESFATRRKHTRRYSDQCAAEINGKLYPVLNWSMGGLQITADDRLFGVDQKADVTLKFHIRGDMTEIKQTAHVIRKSQGKVAFQFETLTRDARQEFQTILDDLMASEFAGSQSV